MFGARRAVTKNTTFGKTAGEKMNKNEEKTIEKMVEKQIGKLASLSIIKKTRELPVLL